MLELGMISLRDDFRLNVPGVVPFYHFFKFPQIPFNVFINLFGN